MNVIKAGWMGLQCLDFKVLFIPSSQEWSGCPLQLLRFSCNFIKYKGKIY